MSQQFSIIRINTVAKYDRHDAIDDAKSVIVSSGGWSTDFRMFSNNSICLQFEIEPTDAVHLYPSILQTRLILMDESREALEELSKFLQTGHPGMNRDIRGTLQVTFIHDEPDLIIEVPLEL
ncbi:hypothetical protein [Paenibacillus gansuensis]|uniref:Glyoxalase n=1 Tax=Paenibacillus gansuensis TaxID=306542 RepID=A0ABW5PBB3_9BACL